LPHKEAGNFISSFGHWRFCFQPVGQLEPADFQIRARFVRLENLGVLSQKNKLRLFHSGIPE